MHATNVTEQVHSYCSDNDMPIYETFMVDSVPVEPMRDLTPRMEKSQAVIFRAVIASLAFLVNI